MSARHDNPVIVYDPGPVYVPCRIVTQSGRPCSQWADRHVGDLDVCHRHKRALDHHIERAVDRRLELIANRRREDEERAEARSVVYFAERAGFVKIGRAVNVEHRLRELARGGVTVPTGAPRSGPLTLLATTVGGPRAERALHVRFDDERVAGEWFRRSPRLDAYIAGLRA